MSELPTIAIVGASLAGLSAARTLRREGFNGSIVVLDADPALPYDKPPLSKQLLAGDWDPEKIVLSAVNEDLQLDLRRATRAIALDTANRQLTFTTSQSAASDVAPGERETLTYDGLILACGASARWLPGTQGIAGVHVVRSLDDSLQLRDELEANPSRVVVIGAGFIGAEVASTCRKRGLNVTLIEAMPLPLGHILGEQVGEVCAEIHRMNGVDLRLGTGIEKLNTIQTDEGERVVGVTLSNGETIDAEVVVIGIGVAVNTQWLENSGLQLENGIVCDNTLKAAANVVACGDIARYPSARMGQMVRIEHWEHAIAGGEAAARTLLAEMSGQPGPVFDALPWFWSDQYDRKIQLAGRPGPDDSFEIVHGSLEEFRFVALYGKGDKLTAVLGMNRPRHVVQLRTIMEQGATLAEAREKAASL
ncbi:MAG: hypothetical protein RLZZ31_1085 [Actinomycetota bacterium]|jgi:3-phenylpropionate/trans-cinnamate dioxygenase ferredoxin reductase subunit